MSETKETIAGRIMAQAREYASRHANVGSPEWTALEHAYLKGAETGFSELGQYAAALWRTEKS